MSTRELPSLLILLTMSISAIQCASVKSSNGRKVVLMSMDGFRHDYLSKTNTPNFDALIASGVKVPYVNNTFATLTFPCHYSIATGRYEESHGIIDNRMFDPEFNANFGMGNVEPRWWDGAEPVWVNAVKSGLDVGTYFWPGSEVKLGGRNPKEWRSKAYNGSIPYRQRIDTLIDDWLVGQNIDLGIIYFDEPDHSGHQYGPEAPEMIKVIQEMDSLLGYFIKKLEDANIKDDVDFILTSDHGMTTIDKEHRLIILSDHVNSSLLKTVVGGGAVANLIPQEGKAHALVAALSGIEHMTVYLKEDFPEEYHYKHHRRVMPVLAVADEGWEVRNKNYSWPMKGNHGYSNKYMKMKPILIASGPSFKTGVEVDPVQNVDIYPLICHLLNINPAPNNGSLERVKSFLESSENINNNGSDAAHSHSVPSNAVYVILICMFAFLNEVINI